MLVVAGAAAWPRAEQATAPKPEPWATRDLRVGIIGTDTSHVPQFTAQLAANTQWRMKVVAAFKGGSPDLPTSADRVEKFAATIRETNGVEIVDSIATLLSKVDVVLLESVDGRPHLSQVTPVMKAGKRVFIDKPLSASLEDAKKIVELGRQTKAPWFTASSARFNPEVARLRAKPGVGKVTKVQAAYTLNMIPFHPDLFFYGIHGIEALYGVMGQGCVSLTRKVDVEARRAREGQYRKAPAAPHLGRPGYDGLRRDEVGHLRGAALRDREVLPDREGAGRSDGVARGDRVHDRRAAQQGAKRRGRDPR
jgi:predicted dehydrogenase